MWCRVEIEVRFRDYVCLLVEGYINVHISPHSSFQLFLSSLFLSILSFLPFPSPSTYTFFFFVGGEGRGIRKHPHSFYLFFYFKSPFSHTRTYAHTYTHTHTRTRTHTHIHTHSRTSAHPHTRTHTYTYTALNFPFFFSLAYLLSLCLRPALYFNEAKGKPWGRSKQDDIEGLSRSELSTLSLPFHPRHATRSDAHEREKKTPGLAHRSFHPSALTSLHSPRLLPLSKQPIRAAASRSVR